MLAEYQEFLQEQECANLAEIASIYQTEEERLFNKPRRQAVPNPALELDMARYKLKIERKFAESYVNHSFVMPRIRPPPQRHSEVGIKIDHETALAFTNRCNS